MSDTIDTTEQIIEDDPIAVRRAKREALMAAGKDPYGHAFAYSHHLADLAEQYADLEDGASTEDEVKVAGRVMAKRDQGKLAFLELRDSTGDMQLFCRINALGEDAFAELKDLDVGDWIGVEGTMMRTKRGQLSVSVASFELLSKSLRPLPEKFHEMCIRDSVGALSDNRLASIRNEKIGFVFQSFNLLGKLTALENVKLPLSYAGVRLKEADARARKQLSLVGLEGREHHLPNQLSGGQQQRVAIARALVCEPEIILADEPTGALDSRTGVEIMELFKSLHAEGQTVILITHNQELADEAQRVVRIADGLIQEMERGSHAV